MAHFSLSDLMFGDHGISHIADTTLSDRARILAQVVRKLFEQGHDLGGGDDPLRFQEIEQAINEAKTEVGSVLTSRRAGHIQLH